MNEIGVETIWISPVYKSPMVDFGYDISDFVDIDPIFGTLEDFKTLVDSAHEFGIKIVMDYVPNHSRYVIYYRALTTALLRLKLCYKGFGVL